MSVLLLSAVLGVGCGDDDVVPPVTDAGPRTDAPIGSDGGDAGSATCTITTATIAGATTLPTSQDAIGGNGDLEVQNDLMRVVFAGIDNAAQIAASGGTIIDMSLVGQGDQMNELSQIGGPAQSLQVRYTMMRVAEQDSSHIVVEATGYVQPMPAEPGELAPIRPAPGTDLTVITRYTVRCGEPAVHIESTLTNSGTQMLEAESPFAIMDIMLWGGRGLKPFCPVRGQGDACRPFDIASPLDGIVESLYVGSTGSTGGAEASYALYTEDPEQGDMLGVHSPTVSSIGYFMVGSNRLGPGGTSTFKRALSVGARADVASASDFAIDALAAAGRFEAATVSGTVTVPAGETLSSNVYDRPLVVLARPATGAMPLDPAQWTPYTMVRVDTMGRFTARVPAGAIAYEVRQNGRAPLRANGGMATATTPLALGDIALPAATTIEVTVVDSAAGGGPLPVPSRIVVKGTGTTADPQLGPETGASPANNVALTDGNGEVSIRVPPGTYDVFATRGMEWSIAHQAVTIATGSTDVTLQIEQLPVLEPDFITADFHVHSGASFDSSLPATDRVMAFVAEDVNAIVSTEHDVIYDYAPAVATVDATLPPTRRGGLRSFVGLEATTSVPQGEYAHTIGHYNAFPLSVVAGAHKSGAPNDEYHNPGELYEILRALPGPAPRLVQFNHARSSTAGRIWLGYFDSCGFDPTMPILATDPCFRTMGAMGTRAWDVDAFEVINGKDAIGFVQMNRDWLSILLQAPGGRLPVGTANSDSHRLVVDQAGYPVTVLNTSTPLAMIDDSELVSTLQSGAAAGANGVMVWAWAHAVTAPDFSGIGPGTTVAPAPLGAVVIDVRVAAPPWVPVDEIRIRVNGQVVRRLTGADLMTPADPFGTAGVVRYAGRAFDVTTRLLTTDAIVTVEAGFVLPRVGDIDGDGRLDATDNDGDDDVDMMDVTMGGLRFPPVPAPFSVIVTDGHPMGFTNPIYLDVNGNGRYDPPNTPIVD